MIMLHVALICLITCLWIPSSSGSIRHHYLAAVEVDWDFAPSGRNMVNDDSQTSRDKIEQRIDRIGSKYRKVIYKGFTDSSFTETIPNPPWAGLLGPTIRAEVGERVFVHFRNMATRRNFSVHVHGFQYNKANEGAVYIDGTRGRGTIDNAVPPGGMVTYVWDVSNIHAPGQDDENCVTWAYHPHVVASRDIDTGLVGFAQTCKKGTLTRDGNRNDVDREHFLYADIANENDNWYLDDNLQKCGDPRVCQRLRDENNQDFAGSNDMYHINGYSYGNLPDFPACEGEKLVWNFMSLNLGTHTIHVNGQTMVVEKRRTDTVNLQSASFYQGHMTPINPGRWLVYCRNQFHIASGMEAFVDVRQCPTVPSRMSQQMAPGGVTRKHFIAIEEVIWDYAPNTKNMMVSENTYLQPARDRIGSKYKKAVYREYMDDTFTVPVPRQTHYGLSGPVIKVEVGDKVDVVLLNRASRPFSFLANGVSITKKNEGAFYKQHKTDSHASGAVVLSGQMGIYTFTVPTSSSPTPLDDPCLTYIYHSAADVQKDIYSGLYGPLIVCKRGALAENGLQKGIDREFYVNWMVADENLSWYIDHNINLFIRQPWIIDKTDQQFELSNQIRAINGRAYGSLEGLNMCIGEKIAWHMYGLGSRFDHHHFSFEGNNFHSDGRRIDTSSVFPGTGTTVNMLPDQAGRLLLRNGQLPYEWEGMYAWYEVSVCTADHVPTSVLPPRIIPTIVGVVRRYYIAAIEGDWDYCPIKRDPINGQSLWNTDSEAYKFVRNGPNFVGSTYRKSIYREFTDDSFTNMKPRSASEQHLGILGPFIRANVGDTVEIVFKNMATHPFNIILRNLVFSDGSAISDALPTMPGQTLMYSYVVPKRSGPMPNEPNCVGASYSSRVHPMNDTYSGLVGPLVICKQGVLDIQGHRTDGIAREFAVSFFVVDENKSNHKSFNFETRAPGRNPSNYTDLEFTNSNLYYSLNGLIYGNLKGLELYEGERTAWYIFGIGSIFGVHTAHFHGQLYLRSTSLALKRDVLEIFPGTHETIEMLGYNPGHWLFHCHVSIHTASGMKTSFTVRKRPPGFPTNTPAVSPNLMPQMSPVNLY